MVDVTRKTAWVAICYYTDGSVTESEHSTKLQAMAWMREQFEREDCLACDVILRSWRGGYALLNSMRHEYEPGKCEM